MIVALPCTLINLKTLHRDSSTKITVVLVWKPWCSVASWWEVQFLTTVSTLIGCWTLASLWPSQIRNSHGSTQRSVQVRRSTEHARRVAPHRIKPSFSAAFTFVAQHLGAALHSVRVLEQLRGLGAKG